MKLTRALTATIFLGAIVAIPATGAQAGAGTGEITIAQMATYDAPGANFPLTICLDDEIVEVDVSAGSVLDPITVPIGSHTVDFYQGSDCLGQSTWAGTTFDVGINDSFTVMSFMGAGTEGISVFENDTSCVPADTARLTVRNASAAEPVDFLVTPEGGTEEAIVSSLDTADEDAAEIPAGPLEDGRFVYTDNSDQIVDLGPNDLENGENGSVYLFGGADGDIDFRYFSVNDPCEVPTTSSSTTTSTSTTTTQAVAAVTTPRFTG